MSSPVSAFLRTFQIYHSIVMVCVALGHRDMISHWCGHIVKAHTSNNVQQIFFHFSTPEFAIKNAKPVNMFDMILAEGKTGIYSDVLLRSVSYEEEIYLPCFQDAKYLFYFYTSSSVSMVVIFFLCCCDVLNCPPTQLICHLHFLGLISENCSCILMHHWLLQANKH